MSQSIEVMETYNICSDMFKVNASEAFKILFKDTDFIDVTLACEDGKQIKAHKVILSACSPFFKDILIQNPHSHPLIYLKGINYSCLKYLMKFIYLGETEVEQEDLENFISSAKDLKIEGLARLENEQDTKKDNFKLLEEEPTLMKKERKHSNISETQNNQENQHANILSEECVLPMEGEDVLWESCPDDSESVTKLELECLKTVDKKEGLYPCDRCEYIAKYNHHLKRHQLSKHELIKFPCSLCESKFTQISSLKRHTNKMH